MTIFLSREGVAMSLQVIKVIHTRAEAYEALGNLAEQYGRAIKSAAMAEAGKRVPPEWVSSRCEALIDVIVDLFSVDGGEVRSNIRGRQEVAHIRQICMYLSHTLLEMSMRQVGECLGRDRTTVMYACQKIENLRDDFEFDCLLLAVERVVRAALGIGRVQYARK